MVQPAIFKEECDRYAAWEDAAKPGDEIVYFRILLRVTSGRPRALFDMVYRAASAGRVFLFQRHKEGSIEYVARKNTVPEQLRPRDPSIRSSNGEW